jgi:hypothetical protein
MQSGMEYAQESCWRKSSYYNTLTERIPPCSYIKILSEIEGTLYSPHKGNNTILGSSPDW